jgi:hypothetical protein
MHLDTAAVMPAAAAHVRSQGRVATAPYQTSGTEALKGGLKVGVATITVNIK